VVLEHLRVYRFAFTLFESMWEHLETSVWLFRVAELFSYDVQTISDFADFIEYLLGCLWRRLCFILLLPNKIDLPMVRM